MTAALGVLTAALCLLTAASVWLIAAPDTSAATGEVKVEVLYRAPTCPSGADSMHPLPGAKLIVHFGSHTIRTRLDAGGAASFKITGRVKSFRAKVVFDGDLIAVDPYGKSDPYSYVDEVKLSRKRTYNLKIDELQYAGAASAWTILNQGADVGQSSMPAGVSLPKVTARYGSGRGPTSGLPDVPGTTTHYDPDTHEILIDSRGRADEFEPWVLLHEYGHHVLATAADPGPDAGGAHDLERSYPNQPALPWSEGFAHAFAAIVRKDPVLGTLCRTGVNLAAHPAVPHSADGPGLNQYHEISIAGTVWGLAQRYGGGNAAAGLAPLLTAFHDFHGKYGGPKSARDARDALTEFGDHHDTELQQAIGNIFDEQRLRWGFSMNEVSEVKNGQGGGWVFPWARGTFCDMRLPDSYPITTADDALFAGLEGYDGVYYYHGATPVTDGPLTYTRHDECWETVVGHYGDDSSLYNLIQTMPYLDGQAHATGKTIIGVVFDCVQADNECAGSSRTVTIRVGTGIWFRPDGTTYLDTVTPLNPKTVTVNVPAVLGYQGLSPSQIVPVAEVDAQGHCKTLDGSAQDCGS